METQSRRPWAPTDYPPHPIAPWLGYILTASWLALLVRVAWQPLLEPRWLLWAMLAAYTCPVYMILDMCVGRSELDRQGIVRYGAFGRRTIIPWSEMTRVDLVRNSAGMREMIIRKKGGKIALANTFLMLPKKGFWPVALMVLAEADQRGVRVGEPWLVGRKGWFHYGSKYLPDIEK